MSGISNDKGFHDVSRAFGKVEQKLDETYDMLKRHVEATDTRVADFSKRIDELEDWQISLNQKIVWITSAFALFFSSIVYIVKLGITYFSSPS